MNLNGFIILYKEKGLTSFQAVDTLKKLLKVKKCGHTGTLDPIAEGVLPVAINNATKMIKYLNENEKEYIAEFKLGLRTDTFDITGETLEISELTPTKEEILRVLNNMVGDIELPIPIFSAVKIDGQRAYKLARAKKVFNAGSRVSTIYNIELLSYSYPTGIFRITCSRGTYVRSFINEMGIKLGSFATMTNLLRTKSGEFLIKKALRLENIKEKIAQQDYSFIVPIWDIIKFPIAVVKNDYLKLAKNGGKLTRSMFLTFPINDNNKYYYIGDIENNIFAVAKKEEGSKYPLKIEHVLTSE